jgi:peptidoglycan/LPS O-acetylase OafA/YrhL
MSSRSKPDGDSPSGHIAGLDGLRAIAVLIVMLSHGGFGRIVPGGFGVTIFFFLSGYLITTLLRRERTLSGNISLPEFYFRRVVRIFPPMYIAIVLAILLAVFGLSDRNIVHSGLVWDVLFLTNYAPLFGGPSDIAIPLWSLDVEEHFYLVFPALYLLLSRWGSNANAAAILLGLCALILIIRIVTAIQIEDFGALYYWTHTRIDSILFGCCLGLWNNAQFGECDRFSNRWLWIAMALAMLLISFAVRNDIFRQTLRYTLQGAALFVIFNFIIRDQGRVRNMLENVTMRFVAKLSYSLYLLHVPVYTAVNQSLPGLSVLLRLVIGTIATFAMCYCIYIFVEKPLAGWRRQIEQRQLLSNWRWTGKKAGHS